MVEPFIPSSNEVRAATAPGDVFQCSKWRDPVSRVLPSQSRLHVGKRSILASARRKILLLNVQGGPVAYRGRLSRAHTRSIICGYKATSAQPLPR